MRKWWAVFVAVVVVVAIAGSGVAEAAKPGGGESAEAETRPSESALLSAASALYDDAATLALIASILSTAQDTMAAIADGLVAEAPSAESQAEFDAMQAAAASLIRDTQTAAADALRMIRNETWSDEVWEAAHAALPVLRASMVAELAVVDALQYPGSAPTTTSTTQPISTTTTSTTTTTSPTTTTTTTTTTSPTTTTTTTSPTTTTTTTSTIPGASSTTTVPGSSTTTSVPGTSSTTTTVPASSTTTTIPATSTTTTVAVAIVAPDSGSSGGDGGFAMVMPPEDAMFGTAAAAPEPPSPVEDLSGWVASMLDVVLPPMVVAVVLSPLIVIEVIGRTMLRSGSAILLPIVMLSLTLLFFRWRDRKRAAAHAVATEGPEAATA